MRAKGNGVIHARMNATLEERVTALEKELAELRKLTLPSMDAKPRLAWMKNIGWAKDDPLYDEALRLGAEYRRTGRIEGDDAGA